MDTESHIYKPFFKEPAEKFTKHLALKGNYRTIVSGKFGIGKTEFLKHYFFQEQQKNNHAKYKAVHLYPVNYQIAENADIFEYIKYDVITRLLADHQIQVDSYEIPPTAMLPFLLSGGDPEVLLTPILSFINGISVARLDIGGAVTGSISAAALGTVYSAINKVKDKLKTKYKLQSSQQRIEVYISQLQNKSGSLYEHDFYTDLIVKLIRQLISLEEGELYESVLIIDDLDRLDPHHVFRLFNVFAAHLDAEAAEEQINKFGFDKIIFVCDIKNVRSLFSHRYGVDADFNGYTDKFYSKEVFFYNPIPAITKSIQRFVEKVDNRGNIPSLKFQNACFDTHIKQMINLLLVTGGISVRTLTKRMNVPLVVNNQSSKGIPSPNGSHEGLSDIHYLFIHLLNVLVDYTGSAYELMIALKRCERYVRHRGIATIEVFNNIRNTPEVLTKSLLSFLGTRQYNPEKPNLYKYEFEEENLTFVYRCSYDGSGCEAESYGFSCIWDEKVFDQTEKEIPFGNTTRYMVTLLRKALQHLIETHYYDD